MKAKKLKKVLVLVLTIVMVMSSASVAAFAETGIAIDSVAVVDGTDGYTPVTNPQVGQKLTANVVLADETTVGSYPVDTNIQYVWSYEGSDIELGTEPVYTVTEDNLGKTITVKVIGTVAYSGTKEWKAEGAVGSIAIDRVAVVDGTDGYTPVTNPQVGQKLTANVVLADETTV
ncbi:MAG: hypothetical protein ACI4WY_11855, partial [Anaerovoracaceae bacterium]